MSASTTTRASNSAGHGVAGAVARSQGLSPVRDLDGGGSGAQSLLARSPEGRLLVVKVCADRADAVDGHDIGTFRRKRAQVEHLRRALPGLARHYPPMRAALEGDGWSATVTNFVPGLDLVSYAEAQGPAAAQQELRAVWATLADTGYRPTSQPAAAGHGWRQYAERIERRLPLLRTAVPTPLLDGESVVIAGRRVPGLIRTLDRLFALSACGDGAVTAAPVHGDLNLRNVVVPSPSSRTGVRFQLLDPRGTLADWDPIYDLAKIVFTLTWFDDLMHDRVQVLPDTSGTGWTLYQAARHRAWLGLLVDDLPAMTTECGASHPGGLQQLLFAHATHVLAEAACRVSDTAQPARAAARRATALLAVGILLVDDLHRATGCGRPADLTRFVADTLTVSLEGRPGR